jgi:phosphoenolpyruvate synthase/pyruvate phosphate dikinase
MRQKLPLRFLQPLTVLEGATAAAEDRTLKGIGAAAGQARGRVRVLRDADDELHAGEILVARATDTGWTPFFGAAAAVVTDIGGVMSHAAIVAREFGIPAVVGTGIASQVLNDHDVVEVDGSAGTVSVVQPARW